MRACAVPSGWNLSDFSPCACQSLLESRRRLSSTTPRHPVFLQISLITQCHVAPGAPVCWPQLALHSPEICDIPQLTSAGISLVLRDFPHPWPGTLSLPSARAGTNKCCRSLHPSILHLPPPLLALPGPIFWFCAFQVLQSSHQCWLSLILRCFSLCFVVGNEQNGLDFNRQVRSSLASQGFSSFFYLAHHAAALVKR